MKRKPKLYQVLLLVNLVVLAALQVRADWLGFVIAVSAWGLLTGRVLSLLRVGLTGLLLFFLAFVTDFSIPSPSGRGGTFSARDLVARVVTVFDAERAQEILGRGAVVGGEGTFSWRMEWWSAIWQSAVRDPVVGFWGHGYGFRLSGLVDYIEASDNVRTPHNVFLYAIGYTGWVGLLVFVMLIVQIFRMQWIALRRDSDSFGICFTVGAVVAAGFSNYFEAPFGAIPFYMLSGLSICQVVALPTHSSMQLFRRVSRNEHNKTVAGRVA